MDRFNPKHHKNPHAHVIHQPGLKKKERKRKKKKKRN